MGTNYERPSEPAQKLADLMAKDLGVTIEPNALRLFLLHRWRAVSLYAHGVHDAATIDDAFEAPTV